MALGDSTTAGTPGFLSPLESPPDGDGDVTSQYAFWLMRDHPEWLVLNRGVNGERSDQIRARFERDVTAERPEVVIIIAGVNDVYQGYPLEHIQGHLQAMYARAAELGITVVAGSVLPYDTARPEQNEELHELNRWLASLPSPIHCCDTHRAVQSPADPDHLRETPEGLHPTPRGYHRMAVALKAVLQGLNRAGFPRGG